MIVNPWNVSARILMVLALASSAVGCATAAGQRSKIFKYNEQVRLQDWKGALDTIRQEIRNPALSTNTYLADINIVAIGALGNYLNFVKVNSTAIDDEARRYYAEALRRAGRDGTRRARATNALALFYSKSNRNGQAVIYFREALRFWRASGDRFQVIKGYHDLGTVFSDQGERALSLYYRRKALAEARTYYRIGTSPAPGQQWVTYGDFLTGYADQISSSGAKAELERIWSTYRKVSDGYYQVKAIAYRKMAEYFAISGDTARARQLFNEGSRIWRGERARATSIATKVDTDYTCLEARIELAEERYRRAEQLYAACLKGFESLGLAMNSAGYARWAESQEAIGALDKAAQNFRRGITLLERARSSFSVAERAAIFSNPSFRVPYWGLIRAQAKRARGSGAPEDFFAAVQATERIRARQFGELLGEKESDRVTASRFRDFAARLPADTVVLDYILMDRTIVVLAFTRTRTEIALIRYDRRVFNQRARDIARRLGDPNSSVPEINRRLRRIGDILLGPVRPLLAGKRRVLLLQDGTMNLIPFGLFSESETGYRPMIEDKIIQVVPSLRFLVRTSERRAASGTRGLFAVGDPAYKGSYSAAGLSQEEMQQVSRGSAYLKYFARLPGTRKEVRGIGALFRGESVQTLFGPQATESAIKTAKLDGFRYLHLATHGILGGEVPGIGEPALVFADEKQEDGLLKASEASRLKLNADMTVLSACNTGTGQFVVGEGVLGMSRAFLLAGSRSVVVSLWAVSDEATARLMTRLYRYRREGRSGAEALRLAALDIRKRQPHPIFWAPFVMVGN